MITRDGPSSTGPTRIRQLNRQAVLAYIRNEGPNSRSALGPALSLSGAGVSSVVNELLAEDLLRESKGTVRDGRQGRPISLLELNPDAAYALGIVLRPSETRTELAMTWVDYTGHATALPDIEVNTHRNVEDLIKTIAESVEALEKSVPDASRIVGLTIAVPGVVENDSIPMSPKLRCIEGSVFVDGIKNAIDYPVSFQNDVNLAATSELYQQPRLRELTFAYLYLYAGVGSAFSFRGEILSGSGGWAGEIGPLHLNRRDPNTRSFEQLLSTDGSLAQLLLSLGHETQALDELADYIDRRDSRVLEVVDTYCEHLCDAINMINSILDLDEILIDFRSVKLFERLRPRLEILLQSSRRKPVISTPVMGGEATLNGAALSALNLNLDEIEFRS